MNRSEVLDTAKAYVTRDRDAEHGNAENNFQIIAELWSLYLGRRIETHEVGILMALLKIARLRGNPTSKDSWIDACGYMAIGGELAVGPEE